MPLEPRRKVLILIPHLGGGGAEQVILLLARGLPKEKYELHLGVLTGAAPDPDLLPPWVAIHAIGAARVRSGALRLLRMIVQLKPHLILSGMAHLNFLVLLLRPFSPRKMRVLVRQNATVSSVLHSGALPWYTRLLYRHLYRHAEQVICQTEAMARDLSLAVGVNSNRVVVLPNPVDLDGIRAVQNGPILWSGSGPHLLAIGRLSPEKGFDLLLEAFASLRTRFGNADLTILGMGPLESALKAQCRKLGLELESAVRFPGYVEQSSRWFAGASLFVLSSRHEGLPNALLEAAAAGLPLVATPASEGLCELLEGQPGTWLAPEISAESLASQLRTALETLRPQERFPHPWIEAFRLERVVKGYEAVIDASLAIDKEDKQP